MQPVLVYSEKDPLAQELVSGARSLGFDSVSVCLLGPDAAARATEFFECGASKAFAAGDVPGVGLDAEALTGLLAAVAEAAAAEVILLGSTQRGKELAGRLAQRLGAGCVTDAIGLELAGGELHARRYALGGNTVATERVLTTRKVISVMPKTFEVRRLDNSQGVLLPAPVSAPSRVTVLERRPKSTEAVDLESAERLVGVGKGLRARQDLALVERLARALRAEIGCTRTLAAEYGWLSEERLIGLSGKKCKPKLYIALGISGQIQHTVGIAGSRIIVGINTDKEAPLFKLADYGIVGDLYVVVPRLLELLA